MDFALLCLAFLTVINFFCLICVGLLWFVSPCFGLFCLLCLPCLVLVLDYILDLFWCVVFDFAFFTVLICFICVHFIVSALFALLNRLTCRLTWLADWLLVGWLTWQVGCLLFFFAFLLGWLADWSIDRLAGCLTHMWCHDLMCQCHAVVVCVVRFRVVSCLTVSYSYRDGHFRVMQLLCPAVRYRVVRLSCRTLPCRVTRLLCRGFPCRVCVDVSWFVVFCLLVIQLPWRALPWFAVCCSWCVVLFLVMQLMCRALPRPPLLCHTLLYSVVSCVAGAAPCRALLCHAVAVSHVVRCLVLPCHKVALPYPTVVYERSVWLCSPSVL